MLEPCNSKDGFIHFNGKGLFKKEVKIEEASDSREENE
jgi:hypothetical protein